MQYMEVKSKLKMLMQLPKPLKSTVFLYPCILNRHKQGLVMLMKKLTTVNYLQAPGTSCSSREGYLQFAHPAWNMASYISEDAWPDQYCIKSNPRSWRGNNVFFPALSSLKAQNGSDSKQLCRVKNKRHQAGRFNRLERETTISQLLLINEFMR